MGRLGAWGGGRAWGGGASWEERRVGEGRLGRRAAWGGVQGEEDDLAGNRDDINGENVGLGK